MRLAVYQGPGVCGDTRANLAVIERVARDAAARGADLVVFPELFTTGYNLGPTLRELAEPIDGPTVRALRATAGAAKIAILCGWPEYDQGRIFNAAVLVGGDGTLVANHRKLHLFGAMEAAVFATGQDLTIAEVGGVRLGVLICYDVEFPESVRTLALRGAELVAVPTALMTPYSEVARLIVPARAAENQLFVAYANRTGREGDLTYLGLSCICDPDGNDLARAWEDEGLLVADLDHVAMAATRSAQSYLHDRRPELYGDLTETPG